MNVVDDQHHILTVISNAGRQSSHPPTSPNTAPATQNERHQWSVVPFKRHFQCVEQVQSPSNLTKYCACHEILKLKISAETPWMLPPIERRFDDNPTIVRRYPTISEDILGWNRHLAPAASETLLVPSWRRCSIVKYNISRSGYLPKCHEVLRLPRKVTRQPLQILRLPRKMNVINDLRHICNVISNAWSNESHPPTSPNTAPATQNELYWTVTLLNCYFTELLLYWTATLLNCDSTQLWLYWSVR